MENDKMQSELWASPENIFYNHSEAEKNLTITPDLGNWQTFGRNHEDSGGTSKVDSGYCSLTPHSVDSLHGIFDKRCDTCNNETPFAQSTPGCSYVCENHGGCKSVVSQQKMPCLQPFSLVKEIQPHELFYEAMDSSLYETDVHPTIPEEEQICNVEAMEIGEEKSVDFDEGKLGLTDSQNVILGASDVDSNKLNKEDSNLSEEYFSPIANFSAGACGISPTAQKEPSVMPTKARHTFLTEKFRRAAKKVSNMNFFFRSFNLNGIEQVDFFYQLGVKKHFPNIISHIFSYLPDRDLNSVSLVCKTWNKILKSDETASKRWKAHKVAMKMKLENYLSPTKARSSVGRPTFTNITNQNSPSLNSSPQRSPPVSPRNMRFHSYQKAAKNLKEGERLLRCPKCFYPSHDKGSPNVRCSRSGCRHSFCVWCRNETTDGTLHDCPPFYTPLRRSTPKVPCVGSKVSKRNLRRLL